MIKDLGVKILKIKKKQTFVRSTGLAQDDRYCRKKDCI